MKKRIVSLGMAMVLCFVCTVSAFAAGAGNSETLYLDDGTVITITVLPDEKFPVSRKTASITGIATTAESEIPFDCRPSEGNYCEVNLSNPIYADDNVGIKVKMTFTGSDGTIIRSKEQTIYAGQRVYLTMTKNDGTGLDCTTLTTLKAVSVDAEYYYSAEQTWK